MRDDIFEDDIFEEDIFEEDVFNEEAVVSPAKTKEDEETEYVVSILKQGVSWIEEAIRSLEKVTDINAIVTNEMFIDNTYIIIKRGKKNYYIGRK